MPYGKTNSSKCYVGDHVSKGLGKIERRILEVLKYDMDHDTDLVGKLLRRSRYEPICDLVPRIYFDINHWRKLSVNDDEFYDPNYEEKAITHSMYQSVARAVRTLEKKGCIIAKITSNGAYGSTVIGGRGGEMFNKKIKLNV